MGEIVIAVYRSKPGKFADLLALVREHQPILRKENLVTEREAILMKAADGTLLEIFEWKSGEAAGEAHHNPAVMELWERMGEVANFPAPAAIPEFSSRFPHFTPVE